MHDTKRHDGVFDHTTFTEDIHIVGNGGNGSAVGEALAKLGAGSTLEGQIHLWDNDSVEPHNLGNQRFLPRHLGGNKARMLADYMEEISMGGIMSTVHDQHVTEQVPFSGIVFNCVDDMDVRLDINRKSIWGNLAVSLMIDLRMDARYFSVFTVDPNDAFQVEVWEGIWYPQSQTEHTIACSGPQSVWPTISICGNIAVNQLIQYAAIKNGRSNAPLYNKIELNLETLTFRKDLWERE